MQHILIPTETPIMTLHKTEALYKTEAMPHTSDHVVLEKKFNSK